MCEPGDHMAACGRACQASRATTRVAPTMDELRGMVGAIPCDRPSTCPNAGQEYAQAHPSTLLIRHRAARGLWNNRPCPTK